MRHTILVIDDQWSMQELARIVLQNAGYRVLSASDAITGLCLARTEHPDITLLDVQLSNFGGCNVLDELRQDPKTATMPVILITTPKQQFRRKKASASCLQKPFMPPDLLMMVDGMLHDDEVPIAV